MVLCVVLMVWLKKTGQNCRKVDFARQAKPRRAALLTRKHTTCVRVRARALARARAKKGGEKVGVLGICATAGREGEERRQQEANPVCTPMCGAL